MGRHDSGVPLEVEVEALDELRARPALTWLTSNAAESSQWTIIDLAGGFELFREQRVCVRTQLGVENLMSKRFVYNFGNPFSGTHLVTLA